MAAMQPRVDGLLQPLTVSGAPAPCGTLAPGAPMASGPPTATIAPGPTMAPGPPTATMAPGPPSSTMAPGAALATGMPGSSKSATAAVVSQLAEAADSEMEARRALAHFATLGLLCIYTTPVVVAVHLGLHADTAFWLGRLGFAALLAPAFVAAAHVVHLAYVSAAGRSCSLFVVATVVPAVALCYIGGTYMGAAARLDLASLEDPRACGRAGSPAGELQAAYGAAAAALENCTRRAERVHEGLRAPVLHSCYEWAGIPTVMSPPYEITGASGPSAQQCNGVYDPTDELLNGRPVFQKRGDSDGYLVWMEDAWMATSREHKEANDGNASCYTRDSDPLGDGPWFAWNGQGFVENLDITCVQARPRRGAAAPPPILDVEPAAPPAAAVPRTRPRLRAERGRELRYLAAAEAQHACGGFCRPGPPLFGAPVPGAAPGAVGQACAPFVARNLRNAWGWGAFVCGSSIGGCALYLALLAAARPTLGRANYAV